MSKEMITTACPSCGKTFELPADLLGNKGRCDACDTKFIIEEVKATKKATTKIVQSTISEKQKTFHEKSEYTRKKKAAPTPAPAPVAKKSRAGALLTVLMLAAAGGGGYYYWAQQQKAKGGATPVTTGNGEALVEGGDAVVEGQPTGLTPLDETFPVHYKFKEIDISQYQKRYPNVHMGWLPSKVEQAAEAMSWGHHLGPIGVRVRSHTPELTRRAAFAANVPDCLRSKSGQLALTAAEVVSIAPGSPADGHLQVGDFIVGIEGEMLKSGEKYRPDWKIMHKARRELQLMLGDKLDEAQGRGDVRLTVLRYPSEQVEAFEKTIRQAGGRQDTGRIPVQAGDEIHLIVDPNGKNHNDHVSWLNPKLSGGSGTLELADESKATPAQATTGWGKVIYGKDLQGKVLSGKGISVHAASRVVFKVPAGYTSFSSGVQVTHGRGDAIAKVVVVKKRQALPVVRKEIWQGKGGGKNVGIQEFDVELPGNGHLTIETHKFDSSIHGDGAIWLDLELEGDYGTKKLFDIKWEHARAGYGRPGLVTDKPTKFGGKEYAQSLLLHSHGEAKWQLPEGTKRVRGKFSGTSYGKVQPRLYFTNEALPLQGIHKDKLVELRFPIGKVGSYSETYPKDCVKTATTAKRHTEWLAAQQRPDGSWPRLAGYTGDGWDTAFCALALMSCGDSKYDEQVKKSAYRIAYENSPSDWTAERAMRLIFLCEYYLRYKDEKILAGIQNAYHQVVATCKTDFMAGHKVNGFGYGIAGQHYGTGHLALALAMASRTPINVDKALVDGVIRHAGEVCVNGTYAYGRGRRMSRNESRRHGGGHAMSGPGLLGVLIGGGHQYAVKEYMERCEASLGDGDNSHATSSLAYIFSSLAMAAADEDVFLKHMQSFKYKMTIDDCWEGGFLKSAFPMDFQGGEGVTSNWIRSAGYVLVLNALKHNLAITGKKEFFNPSPLQTTPVSEWGGQVYSYYFRNWCLAKELLGDRAPGILSLGIKRISELERDLSLVPNTKAIVLELAPRIVKVIAADKSLTELQRAYAIELVTGLDFKIVTSASDSKQMVDLNVCLPLQELNWRDEDKAKMHEHSPFKLKANVQFTGENFTQPMNFVIDGAKGFNLERGNRRQKMSRPFKDKSKTLFSGSAQISYTIGDTQVSYTRPIKYNDNGTPRRRGINTTNMRRFKLKLKVAPRAYYQSQPLLVAGHAFDWMYPAETMIKVTPPQAGNIAIHEGDEVLVEVASENMICGWMFGYEFDRMNQVTVLKPKGFTNVTGTVRGDIGLLHDFDNKTQCGLSLVKGRAVMEYDFGQPVTANGLDIQLNRGGMVRIWYKKGENWVPLLWDNFTPHTGYNPRFADTTAQRWRVEIQHSRSNQVQTLRFYHNTNRIAPQPAAVQAQDTKLLPSIPAK